MHALLSDNVVRRYSSEVAAYLKDRHEIFLPIVPFYIIIGHHFSFERFTMGLIGKAMGLKRYNGARKQV